ncbi:MAG: tRNA lysidine(34) synthetase TilS, partial [Burkholderiales bacterium]
MASSKKSRRRDLRAHVAGLLAKNIKQHLVLGLSGGLDSMVLLDILKALSGKLHFKFSALHVNHQLSLNAASWAEFCRRECLRRAIPLQIVKVKVSGARGLGVEAAARTARYQAYREQKAHTIVLAHHLDDQAETLLLQLLRGGGIKGLSAMPEARSESSGLRILRLLLEVPRSEIKHYAQTRKLKWIEDESNDDTRFDRNFLRHEVLPVMAKHFPVYRETLGRVSRHFAEAAQLLDELGKLDFSANNHQGRLRAAALRELAPARAKNLLRHYLAQNQVAMPGAKKLDEILQQLAHARSDANVKVNLGEWELRRFKGEVYVERAQGGGSKIDIEWHGELRLVLSQNGMLVFRRTQGKGIAYARLIR